MADAAPVQQGIVPNEYVDIFNAYNESFEHFAQYAKNIKRKKDANGKLTEQHTLLLHKYELTESALVQIAGRNYKLTVESPRYYKNSIRVEDHDDPNYGKDITIFESPPLDGILQFLEQRIEEMEIETEAFKDNVDEHKAAQMLLEKYKKNYDLLKKASEPFRIQTSIEAHPDVMRIRIKQEALGNTGLNKPQEEIPQDVWERAEKEIMEREVLSLPPLAGEERPTTLIIEDPMLELEMAAEEIRKRAEQAKGINVRKAIAALGTAMAYLLSREGEVLEEIQASTKDQKTSPKEEPAPAEKKTEPRSEETKKEIAQQKEEKLKVDQAEAKPEEKKSESTEDKKEEIKFDEKKEERKEEKKDLPEEARDVKQEEKAEEKVEKAEEVKLEKKEEPKEEKPEIKQEEITKVEPPKQEEKVEEVVEAPPVIEEPPVVPPQVQLAPEAVIEPLPSQPVEPEPQQLPSAPIPVTEQNFVMPETQLAPLDMTDVLTQIPVTDTAKQAAEQEVPVAPQPQQAPALVTPQDTVASSGSTQDKVGVQEKKEEKSEQKEEHMFPADKPVESSLKPIPTNEYMVKDGQTNKEIAKELLIKVAKEAPDTLVDIVAYANSGLNGRLNPDFLPIGTMTRLTDEVIKKLYEQHKKNPKDEIFQAFDRLKSDDITAAVQKITSYMHKLA